MRMKYAVRNRPLFVIVLLVAIMQPSQLFAFYEQQSDVFYLDARGLVRGLIIATQYPDDTTLYPEQHSSGAAAIARLMINGDIGEQWRFEINAYQTYIPSALATSQGNSGLPTSAERSGQFETSFSDQDYAHLAIDRLALSWSKQNIDLTLGRQAINLATTFYFTPNDFFAPFSAQTFYRVYKPGVDALRAEVGLGEFSQLSLISVLGYHADVASDTGWSNKPDQDRSSHLIRWSNAIGNIESTWIAGRVVDKDIAGAALQGELFEWLGIRFEGHYAKPQADHLTDYRTFSLGFEHRWESSFEVRWELFYNGQGSENVTDYATVAQTASSQYLARRYSALGASYEITPLLNGQAVVISNIDDDSHLLSFNTTYSLSDESEWVVNFVTPLGEKPVGGVLNSEFGSYPSSANAEVRYFF